jgi:hypothetical protein
MPDDTQIDAWKTQVSKDTGVPADVLRGTDLEDIQAHAAALKPLLPPPAGSVPSEGRTVGRPAPDPAQHFAEYLKQQLGYTR